jgi:hypothetical protein
LSEQREAKVSIYQELRDALDIGKSNLRFCTLVRPINKKGVWLASLEDGSILEVDAPEGASPDMHGVIEGRKLVMLVCTNKTVRVEI